jgi:hypothetical protein
VLPPYEFNPFAQSFVPGFIPFLLFPLLCLLFEGANCWQVMAYLRLARPERYVYWQKKEGAVHSHN